MADFKEYKNTFIGSTFPDKPYNDEVGIKFTNEMVKEYIPEIEKMGLSKGFKLLLIIMSQKEGFSKGTRSYRTNNPGNIANTDMGANKSYPTLKDGIQAQIDYVNKIVSGKHKSYPMGKEVIIKPFFSKEIESNKRNYGMSGYLPGYKFTFSGQLDQFVKIYSTGARAGNSYLNMIVSFFKNHGIKITPESKIQEIIVS